VKHVLFIYSQNRLRSPTAELIEWADLIFVMEKAHRHKLSAKFKPSLLNKRVICLDIPDEYEFMDPVLVRLLQSKVSRFLPNV
jgi:predicted protein tyrosine phosphatase